MTKNSLYNEVDNLESLLQTICPLVQRGFAHPVPLHQLPGRRAGFVLRHHLFLEFLSIFGFLLFHFPSSPFLPLFYLLSDFLWSFLV